MSNNILLTGNPRSGKSSLLNRIIPSLINPKGFLTREILEEGIRTGFEVVTNDGNSHLLASVYIHSDTRVSRYGINLEGFEFILEPMFEFKRDQTLYLDEIGEMELYSSRFRDLIQVYLDAPNLLIATLSCVYSDTIIDLIRERNDTHIIEITPETRDKTFLEVKTYLGI